MSRAVLVFRAGERLCAVAAQAVELIMRPLPTTPWAQAPAFVRGVSVIRGAPTPIVAVDALLGEQSGRAARVIALRVEQERRVGLLVDEVLGVRQADAVSSFDLPPLLRDATTDHVEALGQLDRQLLTVLRSAHLIPAALWPSLPQAEAAR